MRPRSGSNFLGGNIDGRLFPSAPPVAEFTNGRYPCPLPPGRNDIFLELKLAALIVGVDKDHGNAVGAGYKPD